MAFPPRTESRLGLESPQQEDATIDAIAATATVIPAWVCYV